ncbi:MAG: ParA family protein [Enterococcus sp.]|uniref:ParA family protein n=1 Tax=Enterococcus TaxID=1350 RepID=UPI00288FDFED|nr:ParA family protein [Enterococcus dongliensis]MDT2671726.1 ParA family protein [Enterococcus dongliensis]MDT2676622.1 ParA family protein [Enterococcus dongliensis]
MSNSVEDTKIISFINMKGGVGKTTLCKEVGYHLAKIRKKRVLLIDTDPQANLTQSFFKKFHLKQPGSMIEGEDSFEESSASINNLFKSDGIDPSKNLVIKKLDEQLSIIPGDLNTVFMSRNTDSSTMNQSIYNFLFMNPSFNKSDYDYILIDCPPTYSEYTISAILASTHYIIPVKPDNYSVLGIQMLEKVIQDIKKKNPIYFKEKPINNIGIIFTDLPLRVATGQTETIKLIKETRKLQSFYFFQSHFLKNNGFFKKLDYFVDARNSEKSKENLYALVSELIGRL